LFCCSHMSHATFHNFLISSKVQHWLDFLDRICFHAWSSCSLHSWLSQPSQMCCVPIAFCASIGVSGVSTVTFGRVQFLRYNISWVHISLSMFLSLSHNSNSFINFSHHSWAAVAGHVIMWYLSSCGLWHLGHWAEDWNSHHCVFFHVAKCPDMYLDTEHWYLMGSSFIALPMESQLMVFQMPYDILCLVQYSIVFCLFIWSLIVVAKSFAIWWFPA